MGVGAFLSNSGRPTQFWIDFRIPGNRLRNFFWIIFVHDLRRLLLPGSIGIGKLWLWRRESERRCREGTKRRASQNGKGKREKYSHKERVLSSISARPATSYLLKMLVCHFVIWRLLTN